MNELHTRVIQVGVGLLLVALLLIRILIKIYMCFIHMSRNPKIPQECFMQLETKCMFLSLGLFKQTGTQNSHCEVLYPVIIIDLCSVFFLILAHMLHLPYSENE